MVSVEVLVAVWEKAVSIYSKLSIITAQLRMKSFCWGPSHRATVWSLIDQ